MWRSGRWVRVLPAVAAAALASYASAHPASAAEPQPKWAVSVSAYPTNFEPDAVGNSQNGPGIYVYARNVGAESTVGGFAMKVSIPPSLGFAEHEGEIAVRGGYSDFGEMICGTVGATAECTGERPVKPGQWIRMRVPVAVIDDHADGGSAVGAVEGGGTAEATSEAPIVVSSSDPLFGFQSGGRGAELSSTDEAGNVDRLAGSHPYQMSVHFQFPQVKSSIFLVGVQRPKKVTADLPKGYVVNPTATPICPNNLFSGPNGPLSCPDDTQVGYVDSETIFTEGPFELTAPLYNVSPPPGVPAEFGFEPTNGLGYPVRILGGVRSDSDYGISSLTPEIFARPSNPILGINVVLWGQPSAPSHDFLRGRCSQKSAESECPTGRSTKALLTMPTSCAGSGRSLNLRATSWETPSVEVQGGASAPETVGCNQLEFSPTISSQATTNVGDSPSGLNFDLHQPQNENYEGRSTAALKDARVTLPEGVAINPSGANGRSSCSPSQIGLLTPVGQGQPVNISKQPQTCPQAAKIGTVEITTPVLGHKLPGSVFVAQPFQNPFGSLLAIYLAVEDEESGIIAKLAGKVEPDAATGQLTATFTENPELPLEDVSLKLFEGPRAVLTTPLTCGTKTTEAILTPWSTPEGADAHPTDSFQTAASCSASEAAAPKALSFTAGTVSPLSSAYSPFVLRLGRPDGSQHITGIETTLPEGLLGKLAGVSYCPESGIAQAINREQPEQGKLEQASPSCPSSSEVGTVNVTAGSGISPIPVSGHAYLAGSYRGAPLSLVVIVPAVAGPFDLGTVVDRVALNVGEYDARIHAVADPFPTIRDGIPLDVRSIELRLDRPSFTLNPTSCEEKAIDGQVTTQTGQSGALHNRFQVGECGRLAFNPKLSLSLKGQTKRTGHPALKAVLNYPKGGAYANIARAQVSLPHSEFLDQGNIGKACTKVLIAVHACPAKSIYGGVRLWTPLLEKPLEGPVYLVGGYGYKLPALVAELNGQIRVLLVGKVDTGKNKGIRNTFEAVPDAPAEKFVLELKGGKKYGLLENSENLCKKTQKAQVSFTAQNGKTLSLSPKIANSCGKGGKKSGGKKQKQKERHRR